jgi:hypothetical protein
VLAGSRCCCKVSLEPGWRAPLLLMLFAQSFLCAARLSCASPWGIPMRRACRATLANTRFARAPEDSLSVLADCVARDELGWPGPPGRRMCTTTRRRRRACYVKSLTQHSQRSARCGRRGTASVSRVEPSMERGRAYGLRCAHAQSLVWRSNLARARLASRSRCFQLACAKRERILLAAACLICRAPRGQVWGVRGAASDDHFLRAPCVSVAQQDEASARRVAGALSCPLAQGCAAIRRRRASVNLLAGGVDVGDLDRRIALGG